MTSRPSTRTLRIKKHLREGTLPKHTQSNDTQNTYAMARCPNTHPGYTQKTFPRARCPNTRLNDTQKIITRGALPKYTKKPHAGHDAQIHKKLHARASCPNKKRLTRGRAAKTGCTGRAAQIRPISFSSFPQRNTPPSPAQQAH